MSRSPSLEAPRAGALGPPGKRADGEPPRADAARGVALVVGVDAYKNGIPSLRTAVHDAEGVADVLAREHGYDVDLCCTDASLEGIRKRLSALVERAAKDDWVLFYFAGHGLAFDSDDGSGPHGYLIPADGTRGDSTTYLRMEEVQASLVAAKSQHVLVILDCCFAGAFRWSSTRDFTPRRQTLYLERYERYLRDPTWQVITSSASDERAFDVAVAGGVLGRPEGEDARHSPFAEALIAGLSGDADVAFGGAPDGIITALELHLYIESAMQRLEGRLGARVQKPMIWSLPDKEKGQFVFRSPRDPENLPSAFSLIAAHNPYKGLAAYGIGDAQLFFGRDALIEELILRLDAPGQPLVVVTAESGAGKSSLVLAGMSARLRAAGASPGAWHVPDHIRPGREPLRELARLAERLGGKAGLSLSDAVGARLAAGPEARILLVIDQLEELVTLTDRATREAFFAELLAAIRAHGESLRTAVTVRSDFEPHFVELVERGLRPDAVDAAQTRWDARRLIVRPMTRPELRAVIESPAAERVIDFEAGLVDRLVDDVAGAPGALSMLSFALHEMYLAFVAERGDGRTITFAHHDRVGGTTGALGRRAEAVHEALARRRAEDTMMRVLLRMVATSGAEVARRRALRAELVYGEPAEDDRVAEVLETLQSERLIVRGTADGREYLEPAHDRLLIDWHRLWQLLRQPPVQELLVLRRRMSDAADGQRRGRAQLWDRDPRLDQAEAFRNEQPYAFNEVETRFLRASVRRRRLRQWSLAGISLATAVVFGVLAIVALRARNEARVQRDTAVRQTAVALARGAEAHVEEALRRGAANEALAWASQAPASLGNANRALRALQLGAAFTLLPEVDDRHRGAMAWSPDGARFAFGDSDGTIAVWDMSDGRSARLGAPDVPMSALQAVELAFAPDGKWLASQARGGRVTLWELAGRVARVVDEELVPQSDVGTHYALRWNADTLLAAAGSWACAWLARDGMVTRIRCKPFEDRGQFAWSPVGVRLLWISRVGVPHIWDPETDTMFALDGPRAASGAFAPDGARVVIGTRDRRLAIYRLASGQAERLAISGTVPYRLAAGELDMREDELGDAGSFSIALRIGTVSWSPAGDQIAYMFGRTAGLWSGVGDAVLLSGDAETLAWSPDGAMLARSGTNGDLRLFELGSSDYRDRRIRPVLGKKSALAWSPAGRWLAVVAERAPLEIWDTESRAETILQVRTTYREAALDEVRTRTYDDLVLSADGRALAASTYPTGVRRWALDGSASEAFDAQDARPSRIGVAWSPRGATLAYAFSDGVLHLRDGDTERRIPGTPVQGILLAWSPDGERIAWGGGAQIGVWSATTQSVSRVSGVREAGGLAWSPDGTRLAVAEIGGEIELRDARGVTVGTLGVHTRARTKVDLAWPREHALVHTTGDDLLTIWNPATAASWEVDDALSYAWSPAGELAVGAWDGVRFVTETGAGARRDLSVVFTEPNQGVHALAWSRDGKLLAIGADLGTILVVSVETGERCQLSGHTETVTDLAWEPGDDGLISSARDGTVRRWSALWKEAPYRRVLENRSNWIVEPDLVARPRAFRGLPHREQLPRR